MNEGIYVALSGAVAQEHALEVVSNNVSNASTSGFKAQRTIFKELLDREFGPPDETLRKVQVDETYTDQSQGLIKHTGNPLDMSLDGRGFFVVGVPGGERLTRSGAFGLRGDGLLATQDGLPVLGQNGEINLDQRADVRVDNEGVVWGDGLAIDRLRVVDAQDPKKLRQVGETLWLADDGANVQAVNTPVQGGSIERANVNILREMSEMIALSRAHQIHHRAIELYRTMDEKAVNELA